MLANHPLKRLDLSHVFNYLSIETSCVASIISATGFLSLQKARVRMIRNFKSIIEPSSWSNMTLLGV